MMRDGKVVPQYLVVGFSAILDTKIETEEACRRRGLWVL